MNWTTIVNELLDTGLTQRQIGEQIGLSQPEVSKLATGLRKGRMEWGRGNKLIALHKKHCRSPQAA